MPSIWPTERTHLCCLYQIGHLMNYIANCMWPILVQCTLVYRMLLHRHWTFKLASGSWILLTVSLHGGGSLTPEEWIHAVRGTPKKMAHAECMKYVENLSFKWLNFMFAFHVHIATWHFIFFPHSYLFENPYFPCRGDSNWQYKSLKNALEILSAYWTMSTSQHLMWAYES